MDNSPGAYRSYPGKILISPLPQPRMVNWMIETLIIVDDLLCLQLMQCQLNPGLLMRPTPLSSIYFPFLTLWDLLKTFVVSWVVIYIFIDLGEEVVWNMKALYLLCIPTYLTKNRMIFVLLTKLFVWFKRKLIIKTSIFFSCEVHLHCPVYSFDYHYIEYPNSHGQSDGLVSWLRLTWLVDYVCRICTVQSNRVHTMQILYEKYMSIVTAFNFIYQCNADKYSWQYFLNEINTIRYGLYKLCEMSRI